MPRLKTPLLFLVFNRPGETAQVFESIRAQQPEHLFIAADGPRPEREGEAALVEQTRAIVSRVDWPCSVKTLFRQENLGCGKAVSGAISWFFSQVEEGIILEDDCLPHPDFFPYCETLLARHRHEPRIATIAGTHFLPTALPFEKSHYASKYFQMWGWASWRRAWQHYELEPQGSEEEWLNVFRKVHPIDIEVGYWREILRGLRSGVVDTWDFQVFFMSWKLGANHLMPGHNLVSNIGYGPSATHTVFASHMANLPTFPITLSETPVSLQPEPVIDNIIFYLRFLESMTHPWWVEQVVCPEQKLGETRTELLLTTRRLRQAERELENKRRQLLAATKTLAELSARAAARTSEPSGNSAAKSAARY